MSESDRRTFMVQSVGAMAAVALLPEHGLAATLAGADEVPVALIGAGRQGRAILAELQKIDQVRIAAVCDVVQSRLRSGLRRARGAKGYADSRQLLERERDLGAVFIATPTHLHRQIAADALGAGLHVYCEAPLASTVQDARAIVAAARESGKILQPGLLARSNPIYRLARSFFRSDAIRRAVSIHAQHHRKTTWRTPAADPRDESALNWRLDPARSIGLTGEWGTHQFDVAHWFLGRYPERVTGGGSIRLHDDGRTVPDTIHCDLHFADGLRMGYDATLANSFDSRFEMFYGSNATIKLAGNAGWMFKEADAPTQGWEVYASTERFHNEDGITLIADATKLAKQGKLKEGIGLPNPPLYYGIVDFLKAAFEQGPIVCSPEEGLRSAAVGIAANRAIVSGEPVEIAPLLNQE